MEKFKGKIVYFVIGALSGLLIAASIVIFQLQENDAKKMDAITDIKNSLDQIVDKKAEVIVINDSLPSEIVKPIVTKITHVIVNEQKDTEIDSASVAVIVDAIKEMIYDSPEEEIVIARDELLNSQLVDINVMLTVTAKRKASDSLLHKISGIRDDKNVLEKKIIIELWKSPLNFKGYKMNKNKLVLYGLFNIDETKITEYKGQMYALIKQKVYKFENTDEYMTYNIVEVDSMIIWNK